MLRLSAGALSVSACALSVRRAQRPRAQSNRRAAATGIVHWAQRAARRSRWPEQQASSAALTNATLCLAAVCGDCGAKTTRPRTVLLVSLPLASESPTPPTRDVESWLRHSSPPSGAVSTPLALARQSPAGCPRALRITVAQDTLRLLFTVPAGLTHRLGARELKRGCPASQVYRSAPRSKSQGCRSKSQGCPRGEKDKCRW